MKRNSQQNIYFTRNTNIFIARILIHVSYIFLQDTSDNVWWDSFASEFFEDDATLTLTFSLEDGAKRYSE